MKKLIILLPIAVLLMTTSCNLKMIKLKNTVDCYELTEYTILLAEENLSAKEQQLQKDPSLSNDEVFMKSISNEKEFILKEKKDLQRYYLTIQNIMKSIDLNKYYEPREMFAIEDANEILKKRNS